MAASPRVRKESDHRMTGATAPSQANTHQPTRVTNLTAEYIQLSQTCSTIFSRLPAREGPRVASGQRFKRTTRAKVSRRANQDGR